MTQHTDLSNLAEVEAAIDQLRFDYIKKLESYLERLVAIVDKQSLANDIDTAIFIAHRIGGVAGTFGYVELGRIARLTESALNAIRTDQFMVEDVSFGTEKILVLSEEIAGVCFDHHRVGHRAQSL